MSDLAPFVAAAIRDSVVLEQQAEIQALRAQRDNLVTVTSLDGTLIYAQGSLATRTVTCDAKRGTYHVIAFTNSTNFTKCPVGEIENAVIRIRGQELCKMCDFSHADCMTSEGDDFESTLYMFDLNPQDEALRHLGPKLNIFVKYQDANMTESPLHHENDDIEQVKFHDVEFSGARLGLFG